MHHMKRILLLAALALALLPCLPAQTIATDGATYSPNWVEGQRNVPFAFHRMTGELFTRSRITITTASAVTILAATTDVSGSTFVSFGAQPCVALDLVNTTTADIEYRRGGTGQTMTVPAGGSRLIIGITDAAQISIRRTDMSTSTITIKAEAIQP